MVGGWIVLIMKLVANKCGKGWKRAAKEEDNQDGRLWSFFVEDVAWNARSWGII